MMSRISLASVLLVTLPALGLSPLGSSEEGIQELNKWVEDSQTGNLAVDQEAADSDNLNEYDEPELEDENYEEENDAGLDKRAIKRCGPDVTPWLISQMNRNKYHVEIQRCRSWYNTLLWPRCLVKFAGLVGNCKPWDFKCTQSFRRGSCPNSCPRTVTLCGYCVNYDVPGNIHYGYVGRAASIRRWVLKFAAHQVQKGGIDDPRDQVAIEIGMDRYDKGRSLCSEIARRINSLNRQGTSGCSRCYTRYY